jgi:hypothetical protein
VGPRVGLDVWGKSRPHRDLTEILSLSVILICRILSHRFHSLFTLQKNISQSAYDTSIKQNMRVVVND